LVPVGDNEFPPAPTSAPKASQSAKEAGAMMAPEPDLATGNPKLSGEEIGKRFLKLIGGLESRNDLSVERVQETIGLALEHETTPGGTEYYVHSQRLEGGWAFVVDYIPASRSLLEGIRLSFAHIDPIADVTPVCGLDFEYYHNALVDMGFLADQYYGEQNLFLGWRYTKFKKKDGTVDMTISIVQMAGNVPGHLCVMSIGTLN
jgi:hypothetical protein